MSIVEENWIYTIAIKNNFESLFQNFVPNIKCSCEDTLFMVEDGQLKTKKYNTNDDQNYDEQLKVFTEKNKSMRQNIELKLEDISKQQTQYDNYKKDQKVLSQEIKDRHEAFLMAKKYYKKFLKVYCTVESKNSESQIIYMQFFTESKKDPENNSLRLVQCANSKNCQLLSITPMLENIKEIQRILHETNDLPGFLCCIRQAFINLRTQNKKEFV